MSSFKTNSGLQHQEKYTYIISLNCYQSRKIYSQNKSMYSFNTKFYRGDSIPQVHFNVKEVFITCLQPEKFSAESQTYGNCETEADLSHNLLMKSHINTFYEWLLLHGTGTILMSRCIDFYRILGFLVPYPLLGYSGMMIES